MAKNIDIDDFIIIKEECMGEKVTEEFIEKLYKNQDLNGSLAAGCKMIKGFFKNNKIKEELSYKCRSYKCNNIVIFSVSIMSNKLNVKVVDVTFLGLGGR